MDIPALVAERVTPWPCFCATWLAMVTVGSGALWPHRTLAQQAIALQTAETLEEIVVSAQRRAEDVQKVPISMQVVTGQDLALQNQNSLDVMSQTVPGLYIAPDGPNNDMYIRGIGSGGYESVDQSVATFVDDIYHGRSRLSSTAFLDLDRVEVLKGPQTTYFGNNAIAGALNIVTKKPTNEFEAEWRALYGSYGQYAFEGALGIPVTEQFAIRLALADNGDSGWITNINIGRSTPSQDNLAGRLTMTYRPIEDFDATLKIEGSNNRVSNGGWGAQPFQIVNCPPQLPLPASFGDGNCAIALSQHIPFGINNNENAAEASQSTRLKTGEGVLTINYRKWGDTITSVTGFSAYNYDENTDGDAVPAYLQTFSLPERYHQISQELRIASPSDQPLEYLAGAYYQSDYTKIGLVENFPFLNPIIQATPPFAPLVPYLPVGRNISYTQDEDVYSLFGAVTWNATPELKLNVGLRGSWVSKNFTQNLYYAQGTAIFDGQVPLPPAVASLPSAFGLGPPGFISAHRTDRAPMPSAGLQYQFAPQTMAYFSFARGFKAGGFNSADSSGIAADAAYGPEHVNAYELGVKSKWLDNRLLLNLDVFRSNYSDLQVQTLVYINSAVVGQYEVRNAASSISQGVEFEGQWALTDAFRLIAYATYADAHYVSYPNASPDVFEAAPVPSQDLSGRPTLFAPKWTGSLKAMYTIALPRHYSLTATISPYFSSSYFLHQTDERQFEQGGYTRLDARLTLQLPNEHWAIDLIGQNLTNADIITAYGGPFSAAKAMPWSVAGQIRYHR
jgi:iron complex outermembrane recepter protein